MCILIYCALLFVSCITSFSFCEINVGGGTDVIRENVFLNYCGLDGAVQYTLQRREWSADRLRGKGGHRLGE